MRDPATRADLLTLTDAVEIVQAHLEDKEYDMSLSRPFEQTLALMSTAWKSLKVTEVRESDFVRKLLGQDLLCRLQNEDDRNQFRRSVASVVNVILRCDGGCGFVISTMAALTAIQRKRVDFQATDKRGDYPRGYMTERLNDVHIDNPAFLKAMREFCAHSASDRWLRTTKRTGCRRTDTRYSRTGVARSSAPRRSSACLQPPMLGKA